MIVDPSTLAAVAPLATALVAGVFAFLIRAADNIETLHRRAADKKERDEAVLLNEQKVERRALELAQTMSLQLELKQARDDLGRAKLLGSIEEVHATAKEAVKGAERAYNEANHANVKIADVQDRLKDAVASLPAAIAAAVPVPVLPASATPPHVMQQEVTVAAAEPPAT